MKAGDFIIVDYTGRVKESGEIFDTTKEEVAKKENVHNPSVKYKPVTIIVDGGLILPGLNDVIKKMEIGKKKKVELEPRDAFGERREELVKLIPLARFKEQNVDPVPGNVVTVNRLQGKISSISGGRVKVDFNHPLAGKVLVYEIEIKGKIDDEKEKIKAVFNYFTGTEDVDVKLSGKSVELTIKKDVGVPRVVKGRIANTIMKWVGYKKIKFVDVFEETKKPVKG